MSSPAQTSYDHIPYQSLSFADSHPDKLAVAGKLFGMHPRDIQGAKILELGCARGYNLIPLACALPGSTFLGIDNSKNQIAHGCSVIERLKLTNIELRSLDLINVTPDLGKFDYIIAHGVFSWVPETVRAKLLEICVTNLEANGIAYVSYNIYPGWHFRNGIREMMLYHCTRFEDPKRFIEQGRAFLEFIAGHIIRGKKDPYSLLMEHELEAIRAEPDWYLYHDYLEPVNDPIYFHQFVARAEAAGLQYLGDSDLSFRAAEKLSVQEKQTLGTIAPTFIQSEQCLDFMFNRLFRCSLLCHKHHKLERTLTPESLRGLYVATSLSSVTPMLPKPGAEFELRSAAGKYVKTNDPLLSAMFFELAAVRPTWISIPDLLKRMYQRLHACGDGSIRDEKSDTNKILSALLKCFVDATIELHSYPPPFTTIPGEYPTASALCRLQVAEGRIVSNFRHETVTLDESASAFLPFLDGQHSRAELVLILKQILSNQGKYEYSNDEALLTEVLKKFGELALLSE